LVAPCNPEALDTIERVKIIVHCGSNPPTQREQTIRKQTREKKKLKTNCEQKKKKLIYTALLSFLSNKNKEMF
jgi:hypothetical protein